VVEVEVEVEREALQDGMSLKESRLSFMHDSYSIPWSGA